jgi:hypothetical protein
MLDDVLGLSICGPEATQLREYLNIKSGSKKLQFAIDKTVKMHIGRKRSTYLCQDAFVDSWKDKQGTEDKFVGKVKVKEMYSTKYLGEILSSDGKNTENISARQKRGYGTVKDITNMLDKMCLGPFMYKKAIILRDSMLVGTLLSCSEAWYNLSETDLWHLEQVDKSLWCNLLEVARTVPYDLVCLELGLEPLRFIIMRRRLLYYQHILKQKETSLVKRFLKTQLKNLNKNDWGKTVLKDLENLEIVHTMEEIEKMSKSKYKCLIKRKIKEMALKYLLDKKNHRNGKGNEIQYTSLKMQGYLISEDMDILNQERKYIFQLRTKMHFKIKSHFRHMHLDSICDGCRIDESTTKHTLECKELLTNSEIVTYIPSYQDIYSNDEDEQVYIARIIQDNLGRIPVVI